MHTGGRKPRRYYCFRAPRPDTDEEELKLRDAIQRVAIENRAFGYRVLRDLGWEVNHKRVARLMREDKLLAMAVLADLKPSIGRMRRLIAPWSASIPLLRYFTWR